MSDRVTTWADGFGVWHASVPLVGNRWREARQARQAILAELTEREARTFDPQAIHVTRERVTNHGTVHYVEVWK